ncbi:hypothetical protein A8C56_02670 [Niabella ginsenosidivorans]|uniref:Uncharacterized protein n=1 Tax=Niabella ginsenosidivorans TaxID=1176587 RepID=A0A1A9HX91_9BACT|nr:hypothetical protein A8C56_02670 [Niabella ginsenosidivorans]
MVFRPFADLQPKQTFIIDSAFVCTENCEVLLNERDPEMEPIFLKLTLNDKVRIDTNCNHIYVQSGLIKNCQTDKRNFFDQKYHTQANDKSGNITYY